jgi:hypothetical protein
VGQPAGWFVVWDYDWNDYGMDYDLITLSGVILMDESALQQYFMYKQQ